jgi:pimeloyl-ACP methyl ester carboxylesterase
MTALSPVPASAIHTTEQFYARSMGVKLFRMGLRTTQSLWPTLAQRLAKRLFLTPLPLAQSLAQAGLVPLILELPAHGHSLGSSSSLPQFARAIEYVAARLAEKQVALQGVVAHSLGAAATAWCAGRGLAVQRLVLIAAADAPRGYTHMFAKVFGLSEATRAGMQRRIEAQEAMTMAQFDAASTSPRIMQPTLVVHDEQDNINHFGGAQRYMAHLPQAQLLATQGLGHRKILWDKNVSAAVIRFIT